MILTVDLFTEGEITVRIVELISSTVILDELSSALTGLKPRVLFQYTFKEKGYQGFNKCDIERRHITESITQVCNIPSSAIERAGQLYDIIIDKKPPKKTAQSMFTHDIPFGVALT